MEFVASGLKLGFEVTFDSPSLAVGISVFDISGPNPVLLAGPAQMINTVGTNSYLGYFTPAAGKIYFIFKAVYTDLTFATLDPNYSQGTETIQAGGVDLSFLVPSIGLTNNSFVPLPDVLDALSDWLQPMVFEVLTKSVKVFANVEIPTVFQFMGVWQPFTIAQLLLKPEGQRTWSWFMCHSPVIVQLKTDDVIAYQGVQFRVMARNDYNKYGYMEYHLVQDWIGSGP